VIGYVIRREGSIMIRGMLLLLLLGWMLAEPGAAGSVNPFVPGGEVAKKDGPVQWVSVKLRERERERKKEKRRKRKKKSETSPNPFFLADIYKGKNPFAKVTHLKWPSWLFEASFLPFFLFFRFFFFFLSCSAKRRPLAHFLFQGSEG
jgi:hypothetical protein